LKDVVTGISGSGPAYFFLLVQILTKVGVDNGLPYDVARGLASQTCLGAGSMLIANEDDSPEEFRRKVTSPNGTTQAGIDKMISLGIQDIFSKGIEAAIARSKELGEILGKL
jgi:pyrroline-5-carboxylate reductase